MAVPHPHHNKPRLLLEGYSGNKVEEQNLSVIEKAFQSVTQEEINELFLSSNSNAIAKVALANHSQVLRFLLNLLSPKQRCEVLKRRLHERRKATLLHCLAQRGYTEPIKCVLDSVPMDERCNLLGLQTASGCTPLHWAARSGHTVTIKYLLYSVPSDKRFTLLKIQNISGNTCLQSAAENGLRDTVEYILSGVAAEQSDFLEIKNKHNEPALDVALKKGATEATDFILHQKKTVIHNDGLHGNILQKQIKQFNGRAVCQHDQKIKIN